MDADSTEDYLETTESEDGTEDDEDDIFSDVGLDTDLSTKVKEKLLKNYPMVEQPDFETCWAATVVSIVKFEHPNKYPYLVPGAVCLKMDHHDAALYIVQNALKEYDPLEGIKWGYMKKSAPFTYDCGNKLFTWEKTIRLYYKK